MSSTITTRTDGRRETHPRGGRPQRGAARGQGPQRHLPAPRRTADPRGRRRVVRGQAGRGRRHRRRVGQRQVGHLDGGDGPAAQARGRGQRRGDLRGRNLLTLGRPGAVRPARPRAGHGLPGPDELAQPGHPGRRSRSPRCCCAHQEISRAEATRRGRGSAAPLRHPRPAPTAARVSAPAVRRDAAARADRHRPGLQAGAADLRRADHRARRDHPGPGAGAAQGTGQRPGHGDGDDHPRPRGGRRAVRLRQRDVRRPGRRVGRRGASCSPTRGTATPTACSTRSRGWIRPAASRCSRSRARRATPSPGRKACAFAPRCRYADDDCVRPDLELEPMGRDGHRVRCVHPAGADRKERRSAWRPSRRRRRRPRGSRCFDESSDRSACGRGEGSSARGPRAQGALPDQARAGLRPDRRPRPGRRRRRSRRRARARRSGWSGSPAAASRRWAGRSCG